MSTENKEVKNEDKGTGACKECGCGGWRGDSGDPEKCLNIRVPTRELCGHSEADHK